MIGNKAKFVAFTSAIALMAIGGVAASSISAQETNGWIEFGAPPDRESEMIGEVADLTTKLQKKRQDERSEQNNEALRGVHPKSHGCVAADFTVLKYIDSAYQVGLFAEPRTYKALIRYSNAAVLLEPDLKDGENGSRGMAIKVLDVNGTILFPDKDPESGKTGQNQDFLMVNTPEFAFANVRDYLRLTRILTLGMGPGPYFIPLKLVETGLLQVNRDGSLTLNPLTGTEPAKLKGAWNIFDKKDDIKDLPFEGFVIEDLMGTKLSGTAIVNIKERTVRNPLEVQYFSASPFRFGPDRVMKFSVIPAAGVVRPEAFSVEEKGHLDDNYLALALKESLAQGKTIHLSFMIQTAEESQLAGRKETMIENAAFVWSEVEFPFVKVAHIVIDPANQKDNEFVDDCRSERFTPWHTLAAHEPLGGINRLRNPVYHESGEFRPNKE